MSVVLGPEAYMAFVDAWNDSWASGPRALPADVWSRIFWEYCHLRGSSPPEFVALRLDLCAKHRQWRDFLLSVPRFWSKICVSHDTPSSDVKLSVDLSSGCRLSIDVVIDPPPLPSFDQPALRPDALESLDNTSSCLSILSDVVSRWRTAVIYASNAHHGRLVLRMVAASAPGLRTLTLALPAFSEDPYPYLPFTASPPQVFNLTLPELESLVVVGTVLPWHTFPLLGHLRRITFAHVPVHLWPSALQMRSVFTAAPILRSLTVVDEFRVLDIPDLLPTTVLPDLSTVELRALGLRDDSSLAHFLCTLQLPSLRTLSLKYIGDPFIEILLTHQFASSATTIVLCSIPLFSPALHHRFVLSFHNVEHLDLHAASPVYFAAMVSAPDCCPRLLTLVLGPVPLGSVLDFVSDRSPTLGRIRRLDFHHGIDGILSLPMRVGFRLLHQYIPTLLNYPSVEHLLYSDDI
ncbi:hypothetical protein C8J57DRAFT_1534308 [Mycena rebaudengoi]|nr:hypothetical protein C8J57DRAFT_1534308 [Mycena rebaudengoi]